MRLLFRHTPARHRHHIYRGKPRGLSPHMMRDIGLEPWPEPRRLHFDLLR